VAHQAQDAWAGISPRSRSEILRRAFDLMTERAEALARLIVLENGKALPDARSEVAYAAEFFRWYAKEAVRLGGMIEHTPLGRTRSWSAPADRRLAPHHGVEFPGRHGHPTRSGRPSSGSTTTTRSPFNLEEVGEAAYHPLSRRPHHPNTTSRAKVDWSSPVRKDWRARPRRRR
jgi:hypothetical protein